MEAETAALGISILALIVPSIFAYKAVQAARQANTTRVLIDLFTEHRSDRLAEARHFIHHELDAYDPRDGLASLPEEKRQLVRDLAWYYDNLGVLIHHKIVDLEPVSGYLGGSVLDVWSKLGPFIVGEREKRRLAGTAEPDRWQVYFETLHAAIEKTPPEKVLPARPRRPGATQAPDPVTEG